MAIIISGRILAEDIEGLEEFIEEQIEEEAVVKDSVPLPATTTVVVDEVPIADGETVEWIFRLFDGTIPTQLGGKMIATKEDTGVRYFRTNLLGGDVNYSMEVIFEDEKLKFKVTNNETHGILCVFGRVSV